jgi:hypothetical protein
MKNDSCPVFMKRILSVVTASAVLAGCASLSPAVKPPPLSAGSDQAIWKEENRSDKRKNSYRIVLKTPGNSITGICILKKNGDEWRGTLISEMGAKAFDFMVTDEKCELFNVIPMLDKWYVKKTVAADLHFLFNADNPDAPFRKKLKRSGQNGNIAVKYRKKQILVKPDGHILLINNRHNLQYELRKMAADDPD